MKQDLHSILQQNCELQKLRLVIEQTPGAIFILDKQFCFEYVNPGYEKLSGYSKSELLGCRLSEIFTQTHYTEPREEILACMQSGRKWDGEIETYRKDGSKYWSKMVASPFNDDQGEIEGYIIIQQDISESKRLELALRESEVKYKTLVEGSLDGILIIENDQILFVNHTICKLLEYSQEELCAIKAGALVHPYDRPKVLRLTGSVQQGAGGAMKDSVRLINKSWKTLECELSVSNIHFQGNNALFLTVRDQTENKRMQTELERSEIRYRELAEMLPLAVYELDKHGAPTYMNQTGLNLLGLDKPDYRYRTAMSFFKPADQALMKSNLDDHTRRLMEVDGKLIARTSGPVEYTVSRPDGTEVPVIIYGTSIIEDGKVAGSRGVMVDISERKAMENALRENEAKYKTLVENSQDGIFAIAGDQILFANATFCRMIGYTVEELYQKTATSLIIRSERAKAVNINRRRRNGDYSTINEIFRFVTKDNVIREADVFSSVVVLSDKKVSLITVHDLTEIRRMQEELIKSEQKYREMADFLPQTIFEVDVTGKLLYINKTGMEIFGLSERRYGTVCYDSFVESDRPLLKQNLQAMMEGKNRELVFEYTARSVTGREFPVMTYSLPVYREKVLVGIRGMVIDISERKATELILQESEKKYRELAEMLPQTVYELDTQGNLRYLNKTGREKFGVDYETHPVSVFSYVMPGQEQVMRNNFRTVTEKFIPSQGNFYTLRKHNGELMEAIISASPMVKDGKPSGSRGVVIDITEHVKMQKALAESEEKYRSLIENATDGIIIVQDGLLKFANQAMCEIMQYKYDELFDQPFIGYVDEEDHEQLMAFHRRRMQGEQFGNIFRTRFKRKDKKIITIELNARTSHFNGKYAGFIVVRDITERIKTENELHHAKTELEKLNSHLEKRVKESSKRLTEAKTQLINLQKENLQSQYEVLKQQVNPHFLFNSLNVLTSLIKLEPDLAEKFSEQLSKVYRYVLENKDNELVDLSTELNFLDAYIFLLNIRFVGKLVVRLNIPEENKNDRIIPLAMQLLIENAIKHNIMSKTSPLIIDIFIDDNRFLNIINNLQERPSQLSSTGLGLKNILNRYQLLNLEVPVFEKTDSQFVARIQLV